MPNTTPTNLHEAVWNWLMQCPYMGDMFFSAGRADDGNTVIFPSESEIETYIDGSSKRYYIAALTRFLPYSNDPNDVANIEALVDFDAIGEWVREQVNDGNMPLFPNGYEVSDIEVLPNDAGYIAAIDMTHAKYMLQFRIEYIRNR